MRSPRQALNVAIARVMLATAFGLIALLVLWRLGSSPPLWISLPVMLILALAIVDAVLATGALAAALLGPAKKAPPKPAPGPATPDQPGSDTPITDERSDKLGHLKFAYVLARHIMKTQPPTTIGIHGKWGTGKTSLGNLIAALLEPRDTPAQAGRWSAFEQALREADEAPMDVDLPNGRLKQLKLLRFNAWQYASADSLWRSLILELARRVEDEGVSDVPEDWRRRLYYSVSQDRRGEVKLNTGAIVVAAVKATALFASTVVLPTGWIGASLKLVGASTSGEQLLPSLSSVFEREKFTEMREQMRSIEEFQGAFRELVSQLLKPVDSQPAGESRVVFFIDDLDRCLPTVALEIMETIKTFLDVPRCIYVLMCDQELLGQGVRAKFQQVFTDDAMQKRRGREYVEKIIQVSFSIPPPRPEDLRELIKSALEPTADDNSIIYFDIAYAAVGDNPRRLKRLCLGLELAFQMMRTNEAAATKTTSAAANGQPPIDTATAKKEFAKVYCLSVAWPDAVDLLTEYQATGEVPSIIHPDLTVDGKPSENLKAAANWEDELLQDSDRRIFGDVLISIDWAAAAQIGRDAVRELNPELYDFLDQGPKFSEIESERLGDYLLWTASLPLTSESPGQSAVQSSSSQVPQQSGVPTPSPAIRSGPTSRPRRALKKK